jgi:hypothetical protein
MEFFTKIWNIIKSRKKKKQFKKKIKNMNVKDPFIYK